MPVNVNICAAFVCGTNIGDVLELLSMRENNKSVKPASNT